MMKLFVEEHKTSYMNVYNNVRKVTILKMDKKNFLEIRYTNREDVDYLPLSDIQLCFLIDLETMEEYFRYEK